MRNIKQKTSWLLLCIMFAVSLFQIPKVDASAGVVTSYEKITWGIQSGRYTVNGILAFCAEYQKDCPLVGTQIVSLELCENDLIRKALYYGYNGPKNVLGTDDRAHVLTAIAISDANIGEEKTGVKAMYDEFYWELVNHPETYPSPPSNFKAYLAHPSQAAMQRLALYVFEERGYVQLEKSSSNESITNGNNAYSLSGAEYGVYRDETANEDSKVGTLVTNEEGKSNRIEVEPGVYFVREIKAPQGYALDEKVTRFEVKSEELVTLQFQDEPQVNPVQLLLQKVDADTGEAVPQGSGSLAGAEFLVNYYKGLWEKGVVPDKEGAKPEKTWTLQTDEKGRIYLNEDVPLGTITVQEVTASKGYQVNPEIFVIQIRSEGEGKEVHTYQYPIVKEQKIPPYQLVVKKMDSYGNQLQGAEFCLFDDPDCQNVIKQGITNEEGKIVFGELEVERKYYLKETKAPVGYATSDQVYEIFNTESKEISLEVLNEPEIVLPKTGSYTTILVPLIGVICCGTSIYFIAKKRRKNI